MMYDIKWMLISMFLHAVLYFFPETSDYYSIWMLKTPYLHSDTIRRQWLGRSVIQQVCTHLVILLMMLLGPSQKEGNSEEKNDNINLCIEVVKLYFDIKNV